MAHYLGKENGKQTWLRSRILAMIDSTLVSPGGTTTATVRTRHCVSSAHLAVSKRARACRACEKERDLTSFGQL
eukprot:2238332-Rhodomonas_salina.1